MDLIDVDFGEDNQAANLTDEERRARFEAAIQVGLNDIAAGRVRKFHDMESLRKHIEELTQQGIARVRN